MRISFECVKRSLICSRHLRVVLAISLIIIIGYQMLYIENEKYWFGCFTDSEGKQT
jgi:hypothetical protein